MATPSTYLNTREAAELVGVTKSAISKKKKQGLLTDKSKDGNECKYDPVDIINAFPEKKAKTETVDGNSEDTPQVDDRKHQETLELTYKIKDLERELQHARELFEREKEERKKDVERCHDITRERDKWQKMAENGQLLLTHISEKEAETKPEKKGLFGWFK